MVHYEVYGRGCPVILLHGWLGSWGLWQETMAFLGQGFRTYALDFWGFGESGKKRRTYQVPDFVTLVDQFMDKLGISCASLVGHSMGGTVSLAVALNYPERAERVVIISSPIEGSSLALPLKMTCYRSVAFLLFTLFPAFRFGMRMAWPLICKDPNFPDMMDRDLSKTTLESFLISIASLRRTDLRPQLHHISVPVMGMFGERDNIVNPNQWKPLQEGVPQARIELFRNAGHFIMLDDPLNFRFKLKDFLSNSPGAN
jgi:pimeloyl-ACP methyl ester carboxylesterase